MAAAGAGGGGGYAAHSASQSLPHGGVKPYPPDWAVFEVTEDTIDDILAHGAHSSPQEIVDNLNALIMSEKDVPGKCGAFSGAIENIEALYPYEEDDDIELTTFLAISKSAGIIGYLSIEQKLGIEKNIFTHIGLEIEALVNKIGWTCSFTNSEVEFSGKAVKDHIGSLTAAHTINMGKYITDHVCVKLLEKLHKNLRKSDDIQTVILFSVGTQEARPRHRKNGKLSACRFLEEWINDDGNNIMEFYDHNEFSVGLMYYYYMPGRQFIGSDLYNTFLVTGSDISQGSGYVNSNYMCPSGLAFNKLHQIIDDGEPYEYKTQKRGRTTEGGGFTKRTRGRRRAYGRPSRRRCRN